MAQDLNLKLVVTAATEAAVKKIRELTGETGKLGPAVRQTGATASAGLDQVAVAATRARRSFVENTASIRDQLQSLQSALLGGFAVKSVIQAADSFKLLQGQLRNVSTSSEEFVDRQRQLFDVAQSNGQSLQATYQLYTRVAGSIRDFSGSTADAVKLTDLSAKAFRISGAGAAEAAGATIQLAQALQSGTLRGDEFNSINEQGGRLVEALADGLGVARGSLRAMAEAGQLTTDKVLPALLSQMEAINREARNLPETVGQALQKLGNSFVAATEKAQGLQLALAGVRGVANGAASSQTALGIGIDVATIAGLTFFMGRLSKIVIDGVKAAGAARGAFAALALLFGGEVALAIGGVLTVGAVLLDLFGNKTPKAIEVEKSAVQKLIEKYQALKAAKEGIPPLAAPVNRGDQEELKLAQISRQRLENSISLSTDRINNPRRSDTAADIAKFQSLLTSSQDKLKVINFSIGELNQKIADAPYAEAEKKAAAFLQTVETKAQAAARKLKEYRDSLVGTRNPQEDPAVVKRILDSGREKPVSTAATDRDAKTDVSGATAAANQELQAAQNALDLALAKQDITAQEFLNQQIVLANDAAAKIAAAYASALGESGLSATARKSLEAGRDAAQADAANKQAGFELRQVQLEKQTAAELLDVRIELLRAQGNADEAAALDRLRSFNANLEKLRAAAGPAGEKIAQALFDAQTFGAAIEKVVSESQKVLDGFQQRRVVIAAQVQASGSPALGADASRKLDDEERIALQTELNRLVAEYNALKLAEPSSTKLEELARQIGQVGTRLGDLKTDLQKFQLEAQDAAVNNLSDSLFAFATGAQSAGQAFKNFVAGFARDVAQLLIRALALKVVQQIIQSIGGFSGGGSVGSAPDSGSLLGSGGIGGGFITGATGGAVSGPGTATSDSIPAMLSNGEYVLRAAAVRNIGVRYLDRLNAATAAPRLPRFAGGGLVGSTSALRGREGGGNRVEIPITVNVPASSSREDSNRIARETRRGVQAAVDERLAYHKLPGGLLA